MIQSTTPEFKSENTTDEMTPWNENSVARAPRMNELSLLSENSTINIDKRPDGPPYVRVGGCERLHKVA